MFSPIQYKNWTCSIAPSMLPHYKAQRAPPNALMSKANVYHNFQQDQLSPSKLSEQDNTTTDKGLLRKVPVDKEDKGLLQKVPLDKKNKG